MGTVMGWERMKMTMHGMTNIEALGEGIQLLAEALEARGQRPLAQDRDVLATLVTDYARDRRHTAQPKPDIDALDAFVREDCALDDLVEAETRYRENLRDAWTIALTRMRGSAGDEAVESALAEVERRFLDISGATHRGETWPVAHRPDGTSGLDAPGVVSYQCQLWEDAGERSGQHPLAPLLRAWYNRPVQVKSVLRESGRIIPARLAMGRAEDQRTGKYFALPAHIESRHGPRSQLALPGFQDPNPMAPALPVALYDLGVGKGTRNISHAAPIPFRLIVEASMAVPQPSRDQGQAVALEIPLRELLRWLYPCRQPRPNEFWPRLVAAGEALDSMDARIPWQDPETGRVRLYRVLSLGAIPQGPGHLDDLVRLVVDLPPGSGNGPQVSDNLRRWGVRSAAAYRLLINLAFHWHNPGVTVTPVGSGPRKRWVPVRDPGRYERISDADLIRLAYPASARKDRRNLVGKAHGVRDMLVQAGEIRIVEGKILPPLRITDVEQQEDAGAESG